MKKALFGFGFALALSLLGSQGIHAATTPNVNYCSAPPYLSQSARPLIHFVLDYTWSMPEYPYTKGPGSTDVNYDKAKNYFGYFKNSMYYSYSGGYWIESSTTCSGTCTDKVGNNTGLVYGNLLNWVATTKLDALRKILTGGRFDTTNSYFTGEGDGSTSGNVIDTNLNCSFTFGGSTNTTRTLTISNRSATQLCTSLGNNITSGANIKIKTTTPSDVTGLIQAMYYGPGDSRNRADLAISFFPSTTGKADYTGGDSSYDTSKNKALSNYIGAINTAGTEIGTISYSALTAAKKYIQQDSTINATVPAAGIISKGDGTMDPYYDSPSNTAAPCRKVFVIFISDGGWSEGGTNDPITPAYTMHTTDLRPSSGSTTAAGYDANLTGVQNVTTYSVYTFGTKDEGGMAGRNAMVSVALFGGFDVKGFTTAGVPNNAFPFPFTAHGAGSTAHVSGGPPVTPNCNHSVNLPPSSNITGGLCQDWTNASFTGSTFNSTTMTQKYLTQCTPTAAVQSLPITDTTTVRWDPKCEQWARPHNWDVVNDSTNDLQGTPYNFFEADDGFKLKTIIERAVNDALGKVSSGTAASILGNNDNNGTSLVQAIFFPERSFDAATKVSWVGEVQSFWYYIDPKLNNITIREDTVADKQLNLVDDRIAEFSFDGTQTLVNLFDSNSDGTKVSTTPDDTVDPNNVQSLWRAGRTLWSRVASDRTIYTNDPSVTTVAGSRILFSSDGTTAATLASYMDSTTSVAQDVINYIRGETVTGTRGRSATIGAATNQWKLGDIINSTPKLLSEVRLNSYNLQPPSGYNDRTYELFYKSKDYNARGTAYVGANDGMLHAFKTGSNFAGTSAGVIASIKNSDGSTSSDLGKELWAFIPKQTLPYLQYLADTNYKHVYYVDASPLLIDASINVTKSKSAAGTDISCTDSTYSQCGRKTTLNSSQQLSYDTSAANGTTTFGTSWRTILLGSTGYGGATHSSQIATRDKPISIATSGSTVTFTCATCTFLADGWQNGMTLTSTGFASSGNNATFTISAIPTATTITCALPTGASILAETTATTVTLQQNHVKTPISNFGYSSFFALDVTEPQVNDSINYPKLMWEYSDPRLGFTNVTPVVVRIKDSNDDYDPPRNGKWYAILASGPTGPIDTTYNQFLGKSDLPLTVFVVDLKSGAIVRTFNNLLSTDTLNSASSTVHTQVTAMPSEAFAGSLSGASIDVDKWKKTSLTGVYSDDAIYIGYTKKDASTLTWTKGGVLRILTKNDPSPSNWSISTLIDDTGPVTSSVTKLQDVTNHKLWLYFGTGRYFYKSGSAIDDPDSQQALYGIKDPCYLSTDTFDTSCTTTVGTGSSNLDNQTTIATPDTSKGGWYINLAHAPTGFKDERVISEPVATSTGAVFFTTFEPSADVCTYGGRSSIWAVNYNTGGAPPAHLMGQILIQLSTGAFQQVNLASAFTLSGGRQTAAFSGVPPKSPPPITSNANHFPSKHILHIQER